MKIVALTGGVGGAKLVVGLQRIVAPEDLTVIVNTGDDFTHLGLRICPDIDTLLYTLSGRASRERGWGREDESWSFMAAMRELGGEDWFQLGDRDLALHILRTVRLRDGDALTAITGDLARAFGIRSTILPMSDQAIETTLDTDVGFLSFQRYFVALRAEPRVRRIEFSGASAAKPALGVIEAIKEADAVLIAPSNPYLSIDPIISVPGLRDALLASSAARVAVSPLVGGTSVKGPTAKLMQEFECPVVNYTIASHYGDLLQGLLVHEGDNIPEGLETASCDTLMRSESDSERVADAALDLARRIMAHRS
ncbi:2-phospho-L-lactate transferase [Phyllobacterium sp. YR531]|uniref:2-phospho-L-lactate transferase n=1 Tax=Phyllobacterium sp. YR531 TaxID=1144343 RepID=UPI00026FB1F8|nr:2-phospho-L-lactate transferase [Phyllobacterium sp. YR531]EJN05833.1 LPPG:FO 2-phospho-L-lactate transferase [Phyllobacterium sp. YR531]